MLICSSGSEPPITGTGGWISVPQIDACMSPELAACVCPCWSLPCGSSCGWGAVLMWLVNKE
eukprot:6003527-Prorocentrum_lima.AAC.1